MKTRFTGKHGWLFVLMFVNIKDVGEIMCGPLRHAIQYFSSARKLSKVRLILLVLLVVPFVLLALLILPDDVPRDMIDDVVPRTGRHETSY